MRIWKSEKILSRGQFAIFWNFRDWSVNTANCSFLTKQNFENCFSVIHKHCFRFSNTLQFSKVQGVQMHKPKVQGLNCKFCRIADLPQNSFRTVYHQISGPSAKNLSFQRVLGGKTGQNWCLGAKVSILTTFRISESVFESRGYFCHCQRTAGSVSETVCAAGTELQFSKSSGVNLVKPGTFRIQNSETAQGLDLKNYFNLEQFRKIFRKTAGVKLQIWNCRGLTAKAGNCGFQIWESGKLKLWFSEFLFNKIEHVCYYSENNLISEYSTVLESKQLSVNAFLKSALTMLWNFALRLLAKLVQII